MILIYSKTAFLIFQSYQPTDFSELMNLVSAQQTTLQSQHAEIKQVCNKNYLHTCFMAFSKLEAMAIYVVKQACGNDIMACVYYYLTYLR